MTRQTLRFCTPLVTLLAAGCAAIGSDIVSVPDSTTDELVIVTVQNGDTISPPRPASTRPGYASANYAASGAARAAMRRIADDYGMSEIAAWPIEVLGVHCAVLRLPAGGSREDVLQRLSVDSRVSLAQPMNAFATRSGYNDPYISMQRGFLSIDAASAQQWSRGEKVRVAVIDTGMDASHPDFGGRVIVKRNFVDRDVARFGTDRHGTAVAGVISASANNKVGIAGVAPAVDIIALKACWQTDAVGDSARCNSLTLAQALAAAIEERAQVVNLSLTGPRDPLLNALVAAGAARGMLYVGASPADAAPQGFPGGAPAVIPVDMTGTASPRGGILHAPGSEVVTLVPGGRYDFLSGSSLATAHVTGAVALLVAKSRSLDRDAAYNLLMRSEVPAGTAINACVALTGLMRRGVCGPATPAQ